MQMIYNILAVLLVILAIPVFIVRAIREKGFVERLKQSFGFLPLEAIEPVANKDCIWVHAASVGEIVAASPLIKEFRNEFPSNPILISVVTSSGYEMAKRIVKDADSIIYFPLDLPYLSSKVVGTIMPMVFLPVETELWPNLIDQAHEFNVPCILINARLSEKSAKGYGKVPSLTTPMLSGLNELLAQDQASLERFITLGANTETSQVVGSIKFDISAPKSFIENAKKLVQEWQLEQRKIITIASTHAPEEKDILAALKLFLTEYPELLCIVVPRHPERFNEVFEVSQSLDLNTQRRSLGQAIEQNTQVYLADSMGEMWLWYAMSQACFVGGSLNEPGGGHNILEPIALNVPTVLGKNYFNFQTIVDEFVEASAVKIVQTAEDTAKDLVQLVYDPALVEHLNLNAANIMEKNKGSLAKHVQVIDQYL